MLAQIDKAWRGQLLDGIAGTNQTLDWMAELVRKDKGNLQVRNLALDIVSGCPGHDFDCEIEALFNYVRDHITYRRDPIEVEWVADAPRTLFVFRSGDCDEKCVALATLLATLGHRSRFVVLGRTRERFTHVYLEVLSKRGWIALDTTPEQSHVGWEASGVIRQTYEIFGRQQSSGVLPVIAIALLAWMVLK